MNMEGAARRKQKVDFLTSCGWGECDIEVLAHDASARTYDRVKRKSIISHLDEKILPDVQPFVVEGLESAVLMDAPPAEVPIKPFVNIATLLKRHGFNPPEIIAQNSENGFLLLEDFGDNSFNKAIATDETIRKTELSQTMYRCAIDVLLGLHKFPASEDLEDYTVDLLLDEVMLFADYYVPYIKKSDFNTQEKAQYRDLWSNVLTNHLRPKKTVIVLRDYHADNLMWLSQKQGVDRVGLLDFQDAVNGSPAYDLVSLLEDARRDVGNEFAQEMLEYYLQHSPEINNQDFLNEYAILGAQRNLKILGIFVRLAVRDNKKDYLKFLPRVWGYLENNLQHPALSDIKDLIISSRLTY